ncbi:MAG TPA: hypothetical protein VM327_04740 [Candidatus Thermoplasmatota archaeon]|nr:hypothetical protein [Candidatus Thermoplasmatota archaeon]
MGVDFIDWALTELGVAAPSPPGALRAPILNLDDLDATVVAGRNHWNVTKEERRRFDQLGWADLFSPTAAPIRHSPVGRAIR